MGREEKRRSSYEELARVVRVLKLLREGSAFLCSVERVSFNTRRTLSIYYTMHVLSSIFFSHLNSE